MYMKFENQKFSLKYLLCIYMKNRKAKNTPPPQIKNPTDWHLTLQLIFNQHKQEKR